MKDFILIEFKTAKKKKKNEMQLLNTSPYKLKVKRVGYLSIKRSEELSYEGQIKQ